MQTNITNQAQPVLTINPTPMSPHQQAVENKLNQTINAVVAEVLTTLIQNGRMNPQEFVATHINPKLAALNAIDERTTSFFKKVMHPVALQLNNNSGFQMGCMMIGLLLNDNLIGEKLVQGIGLPHVQKLMTEFDEMKPTIVDDIIAS